MRQMITGKYCLYDSKIITHTCTIKAEVHPI